MANTENIEAKLCAYVEGDLDDADRAEIEKHLAANPQHRRMLSELMRTRDLLRDLPREKAPAEVAETLQGQLERSVLLANLEEDAASATMRINRWPQLAAIAAVLVLAVGLGLILYQMLPTPNHAQQFSILQDRAAATDDQGSIVERDRALVDGGEGASVPRREVADATASAATPEPFEAPDSATRPLAKGGPHLAGEAQATEELALAPAAAPPTPRQGEAPPPIPSAPFADPPDAPAPLAFGKAGRGLVDPFDELLPQQIPDRRLRHFAEQQLRPEPLVLLVATADIDAAHGEVTRFLVDNSITWHETAPREFPPLRESQVAVSMTSRVAQSRVQAKDSYYREQPADEAPRDEVASRQERRPGAAKAIAQQQQQQRQEMEMMQQEAGQMLESDRARRTPQAEQLQQAQQRQPPERQIVARNISQQQLADLSRRLIEDQSHLRNNVSLLNEPVASPSALDGQGQSAAVIAHGDRLGVTIEQFANQPGLEPVTALQVGDDGAIELDVLGKVQAAGLTEQQLAERLVEQFQSADLIAEAKVKVQRLPRAADAVAAAPAEDRAQNGDERQRFEQVAAPEQRVDLMIVLYQEQQEQLEAGSAEQAP